MNFKELGLNKQIIKVLDALNFDSPTTVQEKIIPLGLNKANICVKSPTGSGKTHAFLLPILNHIDLDNKKVQAIIISPTRELATQIYNMAKPFSDELNIKVSLLTSGIDRSRSKNSIENQNPQIIIGTPGRIKDLAFDNPIFNITSAKFLVLDEADMILKEGFIEEVGIIIERMKDQYCFQAFSASLPNNLIHFLNKYIKKVQYIDLSENNITNSNVRHICYPTRNRDRLIILENLISNLNPYVCIVFASRKETVEKIYKYLLSKDMSVTMIHGDLTKNNRKATMKRVHNLDYKIIVCSDIVARGIDIEGVSEIINFDLPYEEEFYFHRAGRTGRNNLSGTCYTLYDKDEINKLESLYKKGVNFENYEFQNGQLVKLKDLFKKKSNKKEDPLKNEIKKIVKKNTKVKPNYKKVQRLQIEQLKRKHKREIIKQDIKRQRIERYKKEARNRGE